MIAQNVGSGGKAAIGFTILRKFERGVRTADQERVVLLYVLQKG
jgi:hypothetical protein